MDAPEKIWAWEIDHETIPPNGYYATDEVDESTEYTRTDRANELVAAAYEAAALECERAAYSGEYPQNDAIELGCLRSRDFIRRLTPADAVAALAARDARIREAALREAAECVEQFAEISAPDDLKAAILALADTGEDG